jgi:GAF domain-containing protein
MIKLLRYFFVVQHDYHDSIQATQARILMPLTGAIALLSLVFGVYIALAEALGIGARTTVISYGYVLAPALILWTGAALWLTQRGNLQVGATMIGCLLWAVALSSLADDGIAPRALLILPVVITYMGLAYSARGAGFSLLALWIVLPVTAYLQSEGHLAAESGPRDELVYEAVVSAALLTLTTLLLWLFAWNLQRALLRTNRTAAQTRAMAEAGQTISRILNLDELLTRAVDLLRDRFAFYHVQIFLMDEAGVYANLAASTGEIGQALLAQGFRVPIGPRTVVGEAIARKEMVHVPDLLAASYRRPELLANTRTELAVPLVAGDDAVGALDIQSLRPNNFSAEDIEAIRVMANQLLQAIQNARLFEAQQRSLLQNRRLFLESETNLREIQRLNRQLTGQSWQEYMIERDAREFGVRVTGQETHSGPTDWTPAMQQALVQRQLISQEDGDEQVMAVPITLRGQSIGAIEVRVPPDQNQAELRTIIQAVAERMAFSLENARLFEQARMAAEREQQINQITARLQGLTSVEDVLSMAIGALGQALGAEHGLIRLVTLETEPSKAPAAGNGHITQDQNA